MEEEVKNVLVPIAEGFEEIETVTIVDVLRRAGGHVTLASAMGLDQPLVVMGSNRIAI